jgi:hypothetical protein
MRHRYLTRRGIFQTPSIATLRRGSTGVFPPTALHENGSKTFTSGLLYILLQPRNAPNLDCCVTSSAGNLR